jgi:hypothetical protein
MHIFARSTSEDICTQLCKQAQLLRKPTSTFIDHYCHALVLTEDSQFLARLLLQFTFLNQAETYLKDCASLVQFDAELQKLSRGHGGVTKDGGQNRISTSAIDHFNPGRLCGFSTLEDTEGMASIF